MLRRLIPLLALVGLLTACSSAPTPEEPAGPPAAAGAFPVRIDHAYGTTEIPEQPQRVVALGVTDADPVLALGITPVATATYTFYEQSGGLGPWARDLVQGEPPVVLTGDPKPEQIAALAPDLIVAVTASLQQPLYEQLSAIAPVVARPADTIDFGVPRDAQMRTVATALGQPERGEELIAQADAAFAEAVTANPAFKGRTAATVLPFDGKYGAYTAADARGRFMTDLGFALPPRIAEQDSGSFYVEVSSEQAGLLDADTLLMLAAENSERMQIEGDPILQQVPVVAEGRMIVPDTDLRGAITYNSVLSVPYALDRLVPQLATALQG
ncbi:iron-siderophore ABC transporter substrate-binding protein [Pseudonocardia sp. HH130630-07]|uniref:iron-siderophore ABC transporter substrate-binding protein n=1 Tax=Pseudonocardia sp. HH130630-07 TaxID=1690815 RepID=UPI0008151AB6|nr:iron-siderophore ABC transporter substrate-binding protein [Pseudonocardia sp. HH130630-07]ANY09223.1 hypothetical protein AFB00_26600 [Pseudonocardia sp. HH130630-07]